MSLYILKTLLEGILWDVEWRWITPKRINISRFQSLEEYTNSETLLLKFLAYNFNYHPGSVNVGCKPLSRFFGLLIPKKNYFLLYLAPKTLT